MTSKLLDFSSANRTGCTASIKLKPLSFGSVCFRGFGQKLHEEAVFEMSLYKMFQEPEEKTECFIRMISPMLVLNSEISHDREKATLPVFSTCAQLYWDASLLRLIYESARSVNTVHNLYKARESGEIPGFEPVDALAAALVTAYNQGHVPLEARYLVTWRNVERNIEKCRELLLEGKIGRDASHEWEIRPYFNTYHEKTDNPYKAQLELMSDKSFVDHLNKKYNKKG